MGIESSFRKQLGGLSTFQKVNIINKAVDTVKSVVDLATEKEKTERTKIECDTKVIESYNELEKQSFRK